MAKSSNTVRWRAREGWLLGNGVIDLVILSGGGHIADVRFCPESGYPTDNVLWEAPWKTIDPETFRAKDAKTYGTPFVGKFLGGFTGHALCLDLFGAPSPEEIAQGLTLHGEAPVSEWTMRKAGPSAVIASVDLPHAGLKFERRIELVPGESVAYFRETVRNERTVDRFFSWVQHATFGPPLLAPGESVQFVSGAKAKTWPYGYEGKASLYDDREFTWPNATRLNGRAADLRQPFAVDGKGFVVTVRVDGEVGAVAALNWRLGLAAGYIFKSADFPWVTVWEENVARSGSPWNGITRARGVEFGTTPFPVGTRETIARGPLFETPTIACVGAKGTKSTGYAMFVSPVPRNWREITKIEVKSDKIVLYGANAGERLAINASGSKTIFD